MSLNNSPIARTKSEDTPPRRPITTNPANLNKTKSPVVRPHSKESTNSNSSSPKLQPTSSPLYVPNSLSLNHLNQQQQGLTSSSQTSSPRFSRASNRSSRRNSVQNSPRNYVGQPAATGPYQVCYTKHVCFWILHLFLLFS